MNPLDPDRQKRLNELRSEQYRIPGKRGLSDISYPDLLMLLRSDELVRRLVSEICAVGDRSEHQTTMQTPPPQVEPLRAAPSARNMLLAEMSPAPELLALVRADIELANVWLAETPEPEGLQLIRLVALASQWSEVLQLWDRLSERSKNNQRACSKSELEILEFALRLHNLVWRDKQARLLHVNRGDQFDFQAHERGTPKGDVISEQWLPGLSNPAGHMQKKPLVKTV